MMTPQSKLNQLAHRVVHQAMEPSKARNDANVRPNGHKEAGALASRSRSRRPVACGETRGTPAPIRARGNRSADGFRLRDRRPAFRIRSRARAAATPAPVRRDALGFEVSSRTIRKIIGESELRSRELLKIARKANVTRIAPAEYHTRRRE